MAGKRIDIVLVKLCAVLIVVFTMQDLTRYLAYYVNTPQAGFVVFITVLLSIGLPMFIALLLWSFPATIIGPVSSEGDDAVSETDWVVVAVTLIGLYVLIFGVIDLTHYETFRIAERDLVDPDRLGFYEPSPDSVAGRVTNILQIGIGFVLLAGKRGIARLIRAARYR